MKKSTLTFLLTFSPALLAAQAATATTSASASGEASAKAGRSAVSGSAQATTASNASVDIPSTYSAESRAKLSATFAAARERKVPEQPIRDRVAEGQAKGASESQVVLAAQRTEGRLEATQSAMLRAGREPSQEEIARGEHAMARGASEAQIEVIARRTPPERSLVVALNVLTQLQARGVSTDNAVAQIVAKLDARASDQSINQLVVSSNANGAASVATPKAGASAATAGSVGAAASGTGSSVTGAVSATVGGVIKPPMN